MWSRLFGQPREKYSLEEMEHLHSLLLRNQIVTDSNRDTVVEVLRAMSELVIWCARPRARVCERLPASPRHPPPLQPPPPLLLPQPRPPPPPPSCCCCRGDQHDASMVEYFLNENLLAHFAEILQQRSNRRGGVAVQVLQTLSILIQNLRNQQTVFYLFSNNHINEIVGMRFDFEDDEVLGYYVNLLKAISLTLDEATVQFFFVTAAAAAQGGAGRGSPGRHAARPAFQLYTGAPARLPATASAAAGRRAALGLGSSKLPAARSPPTQRGVSYHTQPPARKHTHARVCARTHARTHRPALPLPLQRRSSLRTTATAWCVPLCARSRCACMRCRWRRYASTWRRRLREPTSRSWRPF